MFHHNKFPNSLNHVVGFQLLTVKSIPTIHLVSTLEVRNPHYLGKCSQVSKSFCKMMLIKIC